MRVVDHKSFKNRKQKQRRSKKLGVIAIGSTLAAVALIIFLVRFNGVSAPESSQNQQVSSVASNSVNGVQTEKDANYYTGEQFQELYEGLAFPNTQLLEEAPAITGDVEADQRIQQIAESRGYVLRSVPIFPIVKTNAPRLDEDDLLQPKAFEAWEKLQQAAKNDEIPLQLNSGYRSVEMQRELFLQRLRATGVSTAAIASGQADNTITRVLSLAAPPGYSRHHTGYTIDLFCNDGAARAFEDTACFEWLSEDNYTNAKKSGWLPSYPEGVDDQGPEPEAWEYVWVGNSIVNE
jgi:D-alanyl-D-alanine carboxypeptidase